MHQIIGTISANSSGRLLYAMALLLAALLFSAESSATTYYSDDLLRDVQQLTIDQPPGPLSMSQVRIVVLPQAEIENNDRFVHAREQFVNTFAGKVTHSDFSTIAIKYYPVHQGKVLKPWLVVGIGLSMRGNWAYAEHLRQFGFDPQLLPASVLYSGKFEYELENANWLQVVDPASKTLK